MRVVRMIVLTCCRFRRLPLLLLAALLIPAAPSWAYLHASLAGDLVGKLESVTTVGDRYLHRSCPRAQFGPE